jgi:serine/threonine protein kinase
MSLARDVALAPAGSAPLSWAAMGSKAPRLSAGSFVQQYEVIRPLGEGGMGTVYLARNTRLGRLTALKLLTGHAGERVAKRFLSEARATAQLGHENIVVIHELGEHGGAPYMVLEYLKGKTLEQMLSERQERAPEEPETDAAEEVEERRLERAAIGFPPGRAVELMIPVVRALVCAHEQGIVHRDLKPSNILVTDAGMLAELVLASRASREWPMTPARRCGRCSRSGRTSSIGWPRRTRR